MPANQQQAEAWNGPESAHFVDHADRYERQLEPFTQALLDWARPEAHQVVLDVGCGTGLCFPAIEARIGPPGALIGIDSSPEMLHQAHERVARAGWDNVTLVESSADDTEVPCDADAALLCLAHDVLRSDQALKNVCYQLVRGGRLAVLGGKWAPWYLGGLDVMTWALHRPYVGSFDGFDRPWRLLERHVVELRVEPILFGTAFLAWGSVA